MAEPKTRPTKDSVKDFLNKISDVNRRRDCEVIVDMMSDITGAKPEMWGPNIIGFGRRAYKYKSGRELEWPVTGFSPRKSDLTLYISGFDAFPDLMKRLGKHRTAKVCLYIKKLEDIDQKVLRQLVKESVAKWDKQRLDKKPAKTGSKK